MQKKNMIVFLSALAFAVALHAQPKDDVQSIGEMLDVKLFNAYNGCDLTAFGDLLALDVEFYHDKGGVMEGRESVVEAVEKNICGKVRRELVPGTLRSYRMDNYGVFQIGEHRFCAAGTDKCNVVARFAHLWNKTDGTWHVTRIISYDHQSQ